MKRSIGIGIYPTDSLAESALTLHMPSAVKMIKREDGSFVETSHRYLADNGFYVHNANVVVGCIYDSSVPEITRMAEANMALQALENSDVVKLGKEPKTIKVVDRTLSRLSVRGGKERAERLIPKAFVAELKMDSSDEIVLPGSDNLRGSKTRDGKYLFVASRNTENNPISLRFARKTGEVTVFKIESSELNQVTRTKNTDEIQAAESQPATNAP